MIISRLLFNFFFRRSLIAISNDFVFYIDDIRLAKIITFTILNFSRIAVYELRRYLNVNENCKNHRFTYNITLHVMLKLVFFFIRSKTFQELLFEIRITWISLMMMQSKWTSMIFYSKFCIFLSFVNLTL